MLGTRLKERTDGPIQTGATALVSRNTRHGEQDWRITYFKAGMPLCHDTAPSYEVAMRRLRARFVVAT